MRTRGGNFLRRDCRRLMWVGKAPGLPLLGRCTWGSQARSLVPLPPSGVPGTGSMLCSHCAGDFWTRMTWLRVVAGPVPVALGDTWEWSKTETAVQIFGR